MYNVIAIHNVVQNLKIIWGTQNGNIIYGQLLQYLAGTDYTYLPTVQGVPGGAAVLLPEGQ